MYVGTSNISRSKSFKCFTYSKVPKTILNAVTAIYGRSDRSNKIYLIVLNDKKKRKEKEDIFKPLPYFWGRVSF